MYTGLLFLPLLVAYLQSARIIVSYGNHYLTTSVVAYGSFLTLLYAAIPYTLGQKKRHLYLVP